MSSLRALGCAIHIRPVGAPHCECGALAGLFGPRVWPMHCDLLGILCMYRYVHARTYARNAQTDARARRAPVPNAQRAQAWFVEFLRERWADRRVDLRPPTTSLPPDVVHASLIRAVEQLKLR